MLVKSPLWRVRASVYYCLGALVICLVNACASGPQPAVEPAPEAEPPVQIPAEIIEQVELLRLLPPAEPPVADANASTDTNASAETDVSAEAVEAEAEDTGSAANTTPPLEANATVIEVTPTEIVSPTAVAPTSNLSTEQALLNAEAALQNSDLLNLRRNLAAIDTDAELNANQQVRLRILRARLALLENNISRAASFLQIDSQLLRAVDRDWQISWFSTRADYYRQSGDTRLALRLRMELDRRLNDTDDARLTNQRQLILLLQDSSLEQLEQLGQRAAIEQNRGWYELGQVLVTNQDSLVLRSIALNAWRQKWFRHPASANLRQLLVMEANNAGRLINDVGVILPLSGPLAALGEAVQMGINLASADYVFQTGRVAPQISYFDSASADVTQLYAQASSSGAQLVVGPLLKQEIESLNNTRLTTPVLALNYLDEDEAQNNLFQLGLAARDEVVFIAEQAWNAGCLNSLVLYSDSEWATNSFADFRRHWQQLGGVVLDSAIVTREANLARIISRLVQVSDSQVERAKSFFNRELNASEYEEFRSLGRRSDAECLFLLVSNEQARLIRPLLAFYLANDLSLYATSRINRPDSEREQNQDLDGIYFSELPWLVVNNSTRNRLRREPRYSSLRAYERLVALGVDAFNIYPYLPQLRANRYLTIDASTGTLSLETNQRLVRVPKLVRFINGSLQLAE